MASTSAKVRGKGQAKIRSMGLGLKPKLHVGRPVTVESSRA